MGTGIATYALYKYLKQMTDEEKLHQAYYQADRLWTGNKAIKELHKIMVSQTSNLTSPYTTSKRNKSSSLQCDKT